MTMSLYSNSNSYISLKNASMYNSLTSSTSTTSSNSSSLYPSVTNQSQLASAAKALTDLPAKQKTLLTAALTSVRSGFTDLGVQANKLIASKPGNVADMRSAVSTTPTTLTAVASDKAKVGSYSIEVQQLAKSKVATGDALNSKDITSITAGNNSFSITFGTKKTDMSVGISALDTNKSALDKMAKAINGANSGVSARVINQTVNGVAKSNIVLTATKAGDGNDFSLAAGSGNILGVTNAANETTAAQKAIYSVNGNSFVGQTNEVALDDSKVKVTLKKTTEANNPTQLVVGQDVSALSSQVASFVTKYNKTLSTLSTNSGMISSSVIKDLTSYASGNRSSLGDSGFTMNSDKTLTLDTKKLEKALLKDPEGTNKTLSMLASAVWGEVATVNSAPVGSLLDNRNVSKTLDDAKAQVKQQIRAYMDKSSADMMNLSYISSGSILESFA